MADGYSVKEVDFGANREAIRSIRFTVFVEEQGVPPKLEMDEWDARSRHVLAFDGGRPVATGRLLPDGHIGRVAVLREWRGKGVGVIVMRQLIRMAHEGAMEKALLSSQTRAVGFYERLGFRVVSGVYQEAGIDHVDMELTLGRVDA